MAFTSTWIEGETAPKLGIVKVSTFDKDEEVLLLDKIIPIDNDLSEEFSRQPSLYAYVAMIEAQVESLWYSAKRDTARAKAEADKRIRDKARAMDEKITEAVVANRMLLDDDVKNAEDSEAAYHYQYLVMKSIVASMDQRAQMLISLGAHLRAEADQTGMLIRDAKTRLDSAKQGK